MKGVRVVASALAVMAGLGLTVTAAQQRPAGRAVKGGAFALVGGTLIDGTGGPPVRNSVVLVRGERIERAWHDGVTVSAARLRADLH